MPINDAFDLLLIAAALFFAVFTQTLTGFGMGLVAMPLLTDLNNARSLAAMTVLVTGVTLVLRCRRWLTFGAVRGVIGAAVAGVPGRVRPHILKGVS